MRTSRLFSVFLGFSSVLIVAQTKPPVAIDIPQFQDISRQSGLTAPHISTPEQHYIIESMSGGIGLFDCDDDGKLEIATINGSTVDRYKSGGDPLLTLGQTYA